MTETLGDHVAARDAWARSARGPLALVNAQAVDRPQPVWPVAGTWAPAVGGLAVTAAIDDGVVVDGDPVDGTVLVAGDTAVVPSTVVFRDGLAGTVHGTTLRVWDPASDAVARFARIDRFAPRPGGWVTRGRYEPWSDREAPGHLTDAAGDPLPVAGTIETTIDGATVRMTAVRSAPFHGRRRLQLIVQDTTSTLTEDDAGSSYSMGRFLYLDDPEQPDQSAQPDRPADSGRYDVTLDWERLVLPPCAFSYQYACPVPPEENRMPVALTAGERHPVDASGAVLH
ncbi:DUF1684 domain-containing protein [Curtobacterium sp. ER1/6]|uniref:DUF1684 domain-containing protein n=1 Tax=Curtobacterium sp. ER1/6 TaxID=1891920 RepID=UPI00084FA0BE|nr:DUF1684 domain-containing protein [Curtobacterium sp. ER1/6]OEI69990.1 hypothetical protein Cus16_0608 [Curtobacterium sp. ER1/6]